MGSGAGGAVWSGPYRPLTAGLLLCVGAWAFETLAVATVLPATAAELGGLRLYGWVFSAFLLANLLTIAVAGSEIDRLGPSRPFALGVVLFVVGLLIGGLAPSMPVLIASRVVQGVGSGLLAAVESAVVARWYAEAARPRMLALTSTAWVIAGLAGPALAGLIADAIGWRWVFLGIIPIPLLAALLVAPSLRLMTPSRSGGTDRARVRAAALLAAGMGLFLIGLSRQQVSAALGLVAVGLACLAIAARRLLPVGTLRAAAGLPAVIAVVALLSAGIYGVEAFIPLMLTDVRGQSAVFSGLPLTASALTWSIGSWVLDRRATSVRRVTLVRVGLVLVAVGIVALGAVLSPSVPVVVALLAWSVAGLGVGLSLATLQLVTFETARSGEEGRATASVQLAHTAAIALATGVGGAIITGFNADVSRVSPLGLAAHGALMLTAVVAAVAICGRLPEKSPGRPEGPAPAAGVALADVGA